MRHTEDVKRQCGLVESSCLMHSDVPNRGHSNVPKQSTAGCQSCCPVVPSLRPTLMHRVCPTQLVPQVTELVISELLWLNYSSPERPIYLYVQSTGSQTHPDNQAVAFDTEAHAIIDTLAYIRPDVHTLVIGQARSTCTALELIDLDHLVVI